jgi:hypothetical protein
MSTTLRRSPRLAQKKANPLPPTVKVIKKNALLISKKRSKARKAPKDTLSLVPNQPTAYNGFRYVGAPIQAPAATPSGGFGFGQQRPPVPTGGFCFGGAPVQAPAPAPAPSGFYFGFGAGQRQPPAPSGGFGFGFGPKEPPAPSGGFGFGFGPKEPPAPSGGFGFGANQTPTQPSVPSGGFGFGQVKPIPIDIQFSFNGAFGPREPGQVYTSNHFGSVPNSPAEPGQNPFK